MGNMPKDQMDFELDEVLKRESRTFGHNVITDFTAYMSAAIKAADHDENFRDQSATRGSRGFSFFLQFLKKIPLLDRYDKDTINRSMHFDSQLSSAAQKQYTYRGLCIIDEHTHTDVETNGGILYEKAFLYPDP